MDTSAREPSNSIRMFSIEHAIRRGTARRIFEGIRVWALVTLMALEWFLPWFTDTIFPRAVSASLMIGSSVLAAVIITLRELQLRKGPTTIAFDDADRVVRIHTMWEKNALTEIAYDELRYRADIPRGYYAKPVVRLEIGNHDRMIARLRAGTIWEQNVLKELCLLLKDIVEGRQQYIVSPPSS